MTRQQIIRRADILFNGAVAGSGTGASLVDYFDIAYEVMSVEAHAFPFSYTFSLADSTRLYMVPTYAVEIRPGGIWHSVSGQLEGPLSQEILLAMDKNYTTTEGTPSCWYIGEQNATSGTDTNWSVGFYPVPSAALASGIIMSGFRTPAALTLATEVPPIPAYLHDCYVWGICYFAALREAQGAQNKQGMVNYFEPHYQRAIARLRAGRSGIGAKLWVRGGTAPGHGPDSLEAAQFRVQVTSTS